jgi:hypothetical protein
VFSGTYTNAAGVFTWARSRICVRAYLGDAQLLVFLCGVADKPEVQPDVQDDLFTRNHLVWVVPFDLA